MTDVVHAAPEGGLFETAALCGTDMNLAGNLWLTNLPNHVTCAVCRDLLGTLA